MQQNKSLSARRNELADPLKQLEFLNNGIFGKDGLPRFRQTLQETGFPRLQPRGLEILQLNLGYMCNQTCSHCHVDAGPDRKEMMTREVMQYCLETIRKSGVHTVDLTGGAPEMHPDFRWFVEQLSNTGINHIMVRSNLTILRANPKYFDLPHFFQSHNIHVISSLPFYRQEKTDRQRGSGVFNKSIEALKELNRVGYGQAGDDLRLDLVYNPSGAFLPGNQKSLEKDFKESLGSAFGISFNNLLTITNLPISRFLEYLIASENYEDYMTTLVGAYNPAAVRNLMCTNTLSVSWDGWLYDCDFNQMLDLKVDASSRHIKDYNSADLGNREIRISQHCYGCPAGAGSSCQGSIV